MFKINMVNSILIDLEYFTEEDLKYMEEIYQLMKNTYNDSNGDMTL